MFKSWLKRLFPNKLPTYKQRPRTCRPRLEALEDRLAPASFAEFIDPNPNPNNGFGHSVVALSTGNVVITSPYDDFGGTDAGAVYLFNGATGALISTLRGSTAGDTVGIGDYNGNGGVTALSNGNFVVLSADWNNNGIAQAGAVTWGNGTTGISGVVSTANSLVGLSEDDFRFNRVIALSNNGNYVVANLHWRNGANYGFGAVTWGDGDTGVIGVVSAANSLVGSVTGDYVGNYGVTALSNGNYVVVSPSWSNGGVSDVGAVTWGDGTTGVTGEISADNSLVGYTATDEVGKQGVTALSNGNYVVRSANWTNSGQAKAGAVTWGDGDTGIVGVVSTANSLVGSSANDQVGSQGVVVLSNDNYVVASPSWKNDTATGAGAATWADGDTGLIGVVSAANSLVGSTVNDTVGWGVAPLTNGNYVVTSPFWKNDTVALAGAATWGDGTTGGTRLIGVVSAANSLVGSTAYDQVGQGGVAALSNGNYVVASKYWDSPTAINAGAATWGDGATGGTRLIGVVSAANSLIGSTAQDEVSNGGVAVLNNGNYVVASVYWANGGLAKAGAATWGDGDTGIRGEVSAANSLVGSTAFDYVSNGGVTALSNGNYVVSSPTWNTNAVFAAGAVTWGNGTTGIRGEVSAANSLIGSTAQDNVGSGGVTALSNGNYVVRSENWINGGLSRAGAVTWGNGTLGVRGVVTNSNSVIGLTAYTSLQPVVVDNVNGNFFARFLAEGGGKVRVRSSATGLGDTFSPTVAVTIAAPTLTNGVRSSVVTFAFSEPVVGFDRKDVAVENGSLSNFTAVSGALFTAVFTAKNRTVAIGTVSVGPGYTDVAGNLGTGGEDTVVFNSQTPTLLPSGRVGAVYNQTLPTRNGVGSPGFRVVAGKLPPGLVLSADGVLSGKPKYNTKGVYTFTVEARDTRTYQLTILKKLRNSRN